MITLRQYQQDCLAAILKARLERVLRQLVSLPTGSGKTEIFARLPAILNKYGGKMLVLAHREELLEQAKDKISRANPGVRVEIEQAARRAGPNAEIVVASVPSIGRGWGNNKRISKFRPEDYNAIICDEAHHAVAESYKNVFKYFGVGEQGRPFLIGFTATPKRGDGKGLEECFDQIVFHRDIKTMVQEGWLCPINGYRIRSKTDLSQVKRHMGDFAVGDLGNKVNNAPRNALVVKSFLDLTPDQRGLVFSVDVKHSHDLANLFKESGVKAGCIVGEMSKKERVYVLDAYRAGDLQILVNCMVLTEGFDQPDIESIVLGRPTTSSLLYTQMVGRGTRPSLETGKTDLTVIDIADNCTRHSLMSLPSLFGLPPAMNLDGEDVIKTEDEVEKRGQLLQGVNLDTIKDVQQLRFLLSKVDLLGDITTPKEVKDFSKLNWLGMPDGCFRIAVKDNLFSIRENILGTYDVAVNNTVITPKSLNLQGAFDYADYYISQHYKEAGAYLSRGARWRKDGATDKQIEVLRQFNIPHKDDLTKGEASTRISKYFAARDSKPMMAEHQEGES